nr:hypothetical protein [uncultured Bacteroides sp.]
MTKCRGGLFRSSMEVSVMEMERREQLIRQITIVQLLNVGGFKCKMQNLMRFQSI